MIYASLYDMLKARYIARLKAMSEAYRLKFDVKMRKKYKCKSVKCGHQL